MTTTTSINIWIKDRPNHVSPIHTVLWRIKDASMFGRTSRGAPDGAGQLCEMPTTLAIDRYAPTILEIIGANSAPIRSLLRAFRPASELAVEFFANMRLLIMIDAVIDVDDLVWLLSHSSRIAGIAICPQVAYSAVETDRIIGILCERHADVRALELNSGEYLHRWLSEFDGRLTIFRCTGMRASAMQACATSGAGVRLVAINEIEAETEDDAEIVIGCIVRLFPAMQLLLIDWIIVDAVVMFDERCRSICQLLLHTFEELRQLNCIALIAYTPCLETVDAMVQMRDYFGVELSCRMRRFRSRGLVDATAVENFTLLMIERRGGGTNDGCSARIEQVIVDERNSLPDLCQLCYVLDGANAARCSDVTLEFAGFNDDTNIVER